jgi:hypothetical protein
MCTCSQFGNSFTSRELSRTAGEYSGSLLSATVRGGARMGFAPPAHAGPNDRCNKHHNDAGNCELLYGHAGSHYCDVCSKYF